MSPVSYQLLHPAIESDDGTPYQAVRHVNELCTPSSPARPAVLYVLITELSSDWPLRRRIIDHLHRKRSSQPHGPSSPVSCPASRTCRCTGGRLRSLRCY